MVSPSSDPEWQVPGPISEQISDETSDFLTRRYTSTKLERLLHPDAELVSI
jgi:hypothetical protein